jgi:hypothetical protein
MSEATVCPRCGGELEWLHMSLRGGGCQSTGSCSTCDWEDTQRSGGRPEDHWGEAWASVQALFVERLVASLAPGTRDVAAIRNVLVEGTAEGFHPYQLYLAAVRKCPDSWQPLPTWSLVAPRSPSG